MAVPHQTVIIAEDDQATLQGLKKLLAAADFNVLEYKDSQTFSEAGYSEGAPCVLILGDMAGLDFLNSLKKARLEMPVIFLHSGNSVSEAVKAIQAGADDYISKPFSDDTLLSSVVRAMKKAEQQTQTAHANKDLIRRAASLTRREWEIIHLVLSGLLNKQIAERVGLALITVKVHRGSAMRKLGARTAAELARIARDVGLVYSTTAPLPGEKKPSPRKRNQ